MSAVILGGVVFQGHEVPARIPFGGDQKTVKHTMIGGVRVVDAMGPEDHDISWSGRFYGAGAVGRAEMIDAMRQAGAEIELTWLGMFRLVVIKNFVASPEKAWDVPYTITCEVTEQPGADGGGGLSSLDSLVGGDLSIGLGAIGDMVADVAGAVTDVVGGIADAAFGALDVLGSVSDVVGSVADAVDAISSVVDAAGILQDAALTVLDPIASVADLASTAISTGLATIDPILDIASPDGLGADAAAAWVSGQALACSVQSSLCEASAYVGRVGLNIQLGAM